MDKVVVYAATRNYYKYLPMAVGSLLDYNPDYKVYIIAEDDYIDTLDKENISIINFNSLPKVLDENGPNYHSRWSPLSLVRLYLSKILNEDRILWLDVDTIVLDSLDELFIYDMKGKAIAGVVEPTKSNFDKEEFYINTGVLLMDLKKIREEKIDDLLLDKINTLYYDFPDQDAINEACKGNIYYLDFKFNVSTFTNARAASPKIIHYAYIKLWNDPSVLIWEKFYRERL